jgi:hypothetical protein
LRAVSVNTGKVLATVTVQKTILSSADSVSALKFFDAGTRAFEAEAGLTINEPGTYAVKATIEMAVVELIKEGQRKGVWDFKPQTPTAAVAPAPAPVAQPVISSEIKQEVKVEEKTDVVVQSQTKSETKTEAAPSTATKGLDKLPTEAILKDAQFIYKEPNEKSQKTWQFKPNTQVFIISSEGEWIQVRDVEKRKGFVRKDVIVNKQ